MPEKAKLLNIIASYSDSFEDTMLDFLDEYNLINTQEATEEQLEKYIIKRGWINEL